MSEPTPFGGADLRAATTFGRASDDAERFIPRVYNHVFGAIAVLVAIEVWLFQSGLAVKIASALTGVSWLLVLGGFMVVGWLARSAAGKAESRGMQYAALGAYVVAEAIILVPLLYTAEARAPGAIGSAAILTLLGFAGLTLIAFRSRRDFTMLGAVLKWAGVVALLAIVGGVLFGLRLGTWFSVLMVGVAGMAILRDTSMIMRHYPADRYVAASLQLFASVALMFWYILRLVSSRR